MPKQYMFAFLSHTLSLTSFYWLQVRYGAGSTEGSDDLLFKWINLKKSESGALSKIYSERETNKHPW